MKKIYNILCTICCIWLAIYALVYIFGDEQDNQSSVSDGIEEKAVEEIELRLTQQHYDNNDIRAERYDSFKITESKIMYEELFSEPISNFSSLGASFGSAIVKVKVDGIIDGSNVTDFYTVSYRLLDNGEKYWALARADNYYELGSDLSRIESFIMQRLVQKLTYIDETYNIDTEVISDDTEVDLEMGIDRKISLKLTISENPNSTYENLPVGTHMIDIYSNVGQDELWSDGILYQY